MAMAGRIPGPRNAAEEQARIAESRRLATESSTALTKYPQRGLLLAIEAVKIGESLLKSRVAEAEQSLREVLSVIGGFPLTATDGPLRTFAINPDNRWTVTSSDDETRLWI
jgi:hypothetical protein